MTRLFTLCVSLVCLSLLAAAESPVPLPAQLDLFVGDSRVIQASTSRIAVGNGKIVSVSPVGAEQVVLIGQAVGESVVQLWLADGRQHRMTVTVGPADIDALRKTIDDLLVGVEGLEAGAIEL